MIKVNGYEIREDKENTGHHGLTIFPDKTSQVWQLPIEVISKYDSMIEWEFESEAELIHIAQLKFLLDHHNCIVRLLINYLPYARQDKDVGNHLTFALRPFAHLLNSLRFDRITITDPHSKVALRLINSSEELDLMRELEYVGNRR